MHRVLRTGRARFRRGIQWLWAQEGTPGERARGIGAGVFCGCYPFFGLQIILSVGLASLLRGNHLLAATATLISNPLTYIPLYWFNFQVGCWILGPPDSISSLASISADTVWKQGWDFSSRLLLGSTAVAGITAVLIGGVAYQVFQSATSPSTAFPSKRNAAKFHRQKKSISLQQPQDHWNNKKRN